jgi:hypothetical protein
MFHAYIHLRLDLFELSNYFMYINILAIDPRSLKRMLSQVFKCSEHQRPLLTLAKCFLLGQRGQEIFQNEVDSQTEG